ncbi:MAG: type II secretion system protein [Actinomycetota bacterium]
MLLAIRKRLQRSEESGFTLIELMVVVLIIAILIAIAIPTFLGARQRAQNRALQSNLRNAFTAEKTYYTDNQAYTDNSATALTNIEPSLTYAGNVAPATVGTVYVYYGTTTTTNDTMILGGISASGTCYYIKDVASGPGTTYGSSTASPCPAPGSATVTAAHW